MILVFEGSVGSGKSTLAALVAQAHQIPVYRPFREEGDGHAPGASAVWAKAVKFPINTWMEDLFQADLHAVLKPTLILDRSMPSAIAYEALGITSRWCAPLAEAAQRKLALVAWSKRMSTAGARIVLLKAPIGTCVRRRAKQGKPTSILHVEKEQNEIDRACEATGLPILRIRTDKTSSAACSSALKAVEKFMNPCPKCAGIKSFLHHNCSRMVRG